MKMTPLVLLFGALAFAGWVTPEDDAADKKRAVAETYGSPSLATQSGGDFADAVLPRSSDGHFYATVSVDSQDLRMLVDTGASVIALTGSDAEALGLEWSEDELFPIARGANGLVVGKPVRLDRVRLGEFEADGIEAVIVPQGLDVSLLGQSFLGRIGKVQIEDSRMILAGA